MMAIYPNLQKEKKNRAYHIEPLYDMYHVLAGEMNFAFLKLNYDLNNISTRKQNYPLVSNIKTSGD